MIGVGVAFIVVGLIFLFVAPWVGIAAGMVGVALTGLWLAGIRRRAVHDEPRAHSRG